jgi:hypothetical protein
LIHVGAFLSLGGHRIQAAAFVGNEG